MGTIFIIFTWEQSGLKDCLLRILSIIQCLCNGTYHSRSPIPFRGVHIRKRFTRLNQFFRISGNVRILTLRSWPTSNLMIIITTRTINRFETSIRIVTSTKDRLRYSQLNYHLIRISLLKRSTTISNQTSDCNFRFYVLLSTRENFMFQTNYHQFTTIRHVVSVNKAFNFRYRSSFAFIAVNDGKNTGIRSVFNMIMARTIMGFNRTSRTQRRHLGVFQNIYPLRFYRYVRAQRCRVFSLTRYQSVFYPRVYLCSHCVFLVLFQSSNDQFRQVSTFRQRMAASNGQIIFHINELMMIRVRMEIKYRSCVIFLFNYFGASICTTPTRRHDIQN